MTGWSQLNAFLLILAGYQRKTHAWLITLHEEIASQTCESPCKHRPVAAGLLNWKRHRRVPVVLGGVMLHPLTRMLPGSDLESIFQLAPTVQIWESGLYILLKLRHWNKLVEQMQQTSESRGLISSVDVSPAHNLPCPQYSIPCTFLNISVQCKSLWLSQRSSCCPVVNDQLMTSGQVSCDSMRGLHLKQRLFLVSPASAIRSLAAKKATSLF